MPEREWVLLTRLAAGRTVADMAVELGMARQNGYLVLRRANGRLEQRQSQE